VKEEDEYEYYEEDENEDEYQARIKVAQDEYQSQM